MNEYKPRGHNNLSFINSNLLYCIVYKYLYSTSHGVSQTEALNVMLYYCKALYRCMITCYYRSRI